MDNRIKQKYVPCQLDVVEFKVERGYATSPLNTPFLGTEAANNMLWWSMDKNGNDYTNEQYGLRNDIDAWADDHNNGLDF